MKILVLGGNRFFGRHLVSKLLEEDHSVTLLNRGRIDDGFGARVDRIQVDRKNADELRRAVRDKSWDLIYDQICFTADEARDACRIFGDKTPRYVVTSSESVYDGGTKQTEERFDPSLFKFDREISAEEDYQAAKRQMEATLLREAKFDVAMVRPSLVVGVDDYTNRLKWHLDRVRNEQSIYVPNLDLNCDFIRSDQAGEAMKIIGFSKAIGAFNCTTPGAVSLREVIRFCEEATGKKAVLAPSEQNDNHSPYGGNTDKTMDTSRLQGLGFNAASSRTWIRDLIGELS